MAAPKIHPLEAAVLAALFAAAISLPLVKQLTIGEPDTTALENRLLAPPPDFSGGWKWQLKYLPGAVDAWYSDHFGFRFLLLQADAVVNFKMLSISQRAVIGKNGWFYLKMDPPLFTQSLDEDQLASWKSYLEHRRQWLADRGIKYLFVVAPDKDSIYPEFLPPTSRPPPPELPVDQLVRYLRETRSSVDILSLREALLAAKTREREILFYKHDTHWNSVGGFYASEAIVRHLSAWFPGLKTRPRSDYRLDFGAEPGDIARMAGLPDSLIPLGPVLVPLTPVSMQTQVLPVTGDFHPPFVTQLRDPAGLPRAVMLHDSFAEALMPYLSGDFSRITFFWNFFKADQEKTLAGIVIKEKPDVFIEERVQRYMPAVPDERTSFGGAENDAPGAKNP